MPFSLPVFRRWYRRLISSHPSGMRTRGSRTEFDFCRPILLSIFSPMKLRHRLKALKPPAWRRHVASIAQEFRGQADCCDQAVRPGDGATGNIEGGAVIRARSRKRQTERDVHPGIEGVEFQRDQRLI